MFRLGFLGFCFLETVSPDEIGFFSRVTGGAVGIVGSTSGAVIGIFVLVVLGGVVAVRVRKR